MLYCCVFQLTKCCRCCRDSHLPFLLNVTVFDRCKAILCSRHWTLSFRDFSDILSQLLNYNSCLFMRFVFMSFLYLFFLATYKLNGPIKKLRLQKLQKIVKSEEITAFAMHYLLSLYGINIDMQPWFESVG